MTVVEPGIDKGSTSISRIPASSDKDLVMEDGSKPDEFSQYNTQKCFKFPKLLSGYINFAYMILLVPFKLEYNNKDNKFNLKHNYGQIILYGLAHFCILGHNAKDLLPNLSQSMKKDPSNIYGIAELTSYCLFHLTFLRFGWTKKQCILKIVNQTKMPPLSSKEYQKVTWITRVLMGSFFLVRVIKFINEHFIQISNKSQIVLGLSECLQHYFLPVMNTTIECEEPIFSSFASPILIIYIPSFINSLSDGFSSMLCMCGAYAIYELVSDLNSQFPKMPKPKDYVGILKAFVQCKNKVGDIDEAVKDIFLFEFSSLCLFLPIQLFVILDGDVHIVKRIVPIIVYTLNFVTLWMAAESMKKMENFHSSLKDNLLAEVSEKQSGDLTVFKDTPYLLIHSSISDFGLKGGNFFTVSYSFIGTTLSFLLAYTLVLIQFKVAA